ncbi:type II toxin-antitoxin system VapC family toxin [Patescibacteria group bacterium]|nr:type II toxin-antitoxin system VapC family toxin [Patescibacteria group bacterium]
MNIIDSSAWLEFFTGGKNAGTYKEVIRQTEKLVIPTIILYEVYKKITMERDEDTALKYVGNMKNAKIADLDTHLAILAASISKEHKLALADSIILATAQKYGATIWTQDADFQGLPDVKYFPKQ